MERKVPFTIGEAYHLYTRGVEKRIVFQETKDYERFLYLLFACNDTAPLKTSNSLAYRRGFPSLAEREREPIVSILAYALMPNHIHLLVREISAGGISKFMLKLMTAYSMYFNTKYARSGPLFTRPFRSKHIDSDEYFRWVFAYITLNPLDLYDEQWRKSGLTNEKTAGEFLRDYRYSNFSDYFISSRPESCLLDKESGHGLVDTFDSLLSLLAHATPSYQENSLDAARASAALV
jgi:REP element-mobilizing transposase RayT